MPDKKPTHNKGTDKKKQNTYEQDQEAMRKTGNSDPQSNKPLENFERETDNSIQRGQRTIQNEQRG
jgi:hypothetical protein